MQGWIKLHRELMEKAIWLESTPEQKTILITILAMANHKEKEWEWKGERFKAEPGQFVTSLENITRKCGKGVSIQNVRTALGRFKKYEFLTDESTNRNRLITVVNWGVYQQENDDTNKQTNKQLTSNQQATNKQLTTNKNDKNVKNDNNIKDSRKQVYDETSLYYKMTDYFYKLILKNNPQHKKPNYQRWSDDFRKIVELDKRDKDQVRKVMEFVQADDFEFKNVLSPSKLRKRYDQLLMKSNQAKANNFVKPKYEVVEGGKGNEKHTEKGGNVQLFR